MHIGARENLTHIAWVLHVSRFNELRFRGAEVFLGKAKS